MREAMLAVLRDTPLLPGANPLLTISVALVAGIAAGALGRRLHVPGITGQICVGILLGPSVIHLFGVTTIHQLGPFVDFALGLMAVTVGSHLNLRRLANARRRLIYLLVLEALITPAVVFLLLITLSDVPWYVCLLLGSIAVSTAPATILSIVQETRGRGVFVKTLVAGVALNNLACILLFEVAHTASLHHLGSGHTALDVALAPVIEIVSSLLLGGGLGCLLVLGTRNIVRPDRLAALSLVAILLTVGLAEQTGISSLLACLVLGFTLANITPEKEEIGHEVLDNFEYAIFAVFFTLAGMELDFRYLIPGGVVALLAFGGRFAGKLSAAYLAMRLSGATERMRRNLGLALIPQAGLAVGLMLLVTEDPAFVGIRDLFLAVVLTLVLANELVGPILTRRAVMASGDAGRDRARLIDFLHEEHIVVGLQAETKEAAIEQLVDHLRRTHELAVDRERLLLGVLEREREHSTCVGDGLAIPQGPLEDGDAIVGVMGISRVGLPFATPDGRPVHCMVLLATPEAEYDRYLEVFAALARAIGHDRLVRDQLYSTESAAHAYELLHVDEESEDFNYFLEDE